MPRIAGVSFVSYADHVLDNKEHHIMYSWSIIYVTGLSRIGRGTLYHL